jgi:hypothetical protein
MKKRPNKYKTKRINWKTLDSSKHQKFDLKNWADSTWKKEIDSKLSKPGIYCLHDGKRIFYIGISTAGIMRDRWDPKIASGHDYGKKRRKDGKRSGAKWQGQGNFASGTLRFTIEGSNHQKIETKPRLDYKQYPLYPQKFKKQKNRLIKKIQKAKESQTTLIEFVEYFLIRKAGFVHGFGGLTPDVTVQKSKFNEIITSRDFITKKATLKTGWTMVNKKDGIPYSNTKFADSNLKQNSVTKDKAKVARELRIKIVCGGVSNPFTGNKGLLSTPADFESLRDYEGNSKQKLPQTYSIQSTAAKQHSKPLSKISSNLKTASKKTPRKKTTSKAKAPKGKAASKAKTPRKKTTSKAKAPKGKAASKAKTPRRKNITRR